MENLRNRIEKGFEVFAATIYRHRIKTLLVMGVLIAALLANFLLAPALMVLVNDKKAQTEQMGEYAQAS